ncbi:MAG: CSLREA domain-containing protein [Acidobacteria bacterium]|nr:CSLREA domain-containing protein [Acidobacteriota bacterium]
MLLIGPLIAAGSSAYAATFTVNTTTDAVDANPGNGVCATSGGSCSLRAAIQEANALAGADVITLPAGVYQLTISGTAEDQAATGDLDIRTDITINGADARTTFIQAGSGPGLGIDRVFDVPIGVSGILSLNNATVRYGTDSSGVGGGGLQLNAPGVGGAFNLNNVLVTQNTSTANGGAMRISGGTVNIVNSAITNNSSSGGQGGAALCNNLCTLRITNSTLSANSGTNGGSLRNTINTSITLTNSTITRNTASAGTGGINTSAGGTMNIRNTIVTDNTGTTDNDATGVVTSGGNNLIGSQGTSTGWVGTDLLNNPNARLAPLGNYGGSTPTHSLLSGSAAINAGSNCVNNSSCATFNAPANVAADERGFARPASATTDIGAFELPAAPTDFTAVLPAADKNQAYTTTLAPNTTVGATTYTYTLFGGDTLPNGLNLTTAFAPAAAEQITGTPTVNGTFFFRVQVSDGANTQVTRYQLTINAPTAASAGISGRVMDAKGRGIARARVVMTLQDGASRTATTNSFGNYRFDDVAVGQTVILNVSSKSGIFPAAALNVGDEITGFDLWALD